MRLTKNNVIDYIPRNQFRYYYKKLSEDEKVAYKIIVDNLLIHKSCFLMQSPVPYYKICRIVDCILRDVPEIFYVRCFSLRPVDSSKLLFRVEYTHSEKQILELLDKLDEKAECLAPYRACSQLGRVKAITNFLSKNLRYTRDNGRSDHTVLSLLYGSGCCQGISSCFKYLSDRLNLDSLILTGRLANTEVHHALNTVLLSGDYFYVDVTNAMAYADPCKCPYFGCKSKDIFDKYEDVIGPPCH